MNLKQNALHIPVMIKEIEEMLTPRLAHHNPRYFDGTFGRGGHFNFLLQKNPSLQTVAFDQDLEAIEYAQKNFSSLIENHQLEIVHKNFSEFDSHVYGLFDAMLLDLGVSSPQLDQGQRGFSFYHEGPLDMRMNQTQQLTASDIISDYSEDELNKLFQEYGEIQRPYRVVTAIVHDRKEKKFSTTRELAGLIERVDGWRKKGHHPATQYFLALRMIVNRELEILPESLQKLILGLKPKGRLAVLTFHSLEDRIVKNTFKELTHLGQAVNKKVIQPEWTEAKSNSRARSAKLRVFERSDRSEQV